MTDLRKGSDRAESQASVAVAMAVGSIFVDIDSRGGIGRSQQQLL